VAFRAATLAAMLGAAAPAAAGETLKYGGSLIFMIRADAPPSFDVHREGTFATVHQHPSYINTAQLVRASPMELAVLVTAPQRNYGPLTTAVRNLIRAAVAAHGILPADQATMVANIG
jgi:hypothetical protein